MRSPAREPAGCSPKVAEVLPILYLRGLSTGDFKEGLAALLGDDASGLSPTAITRLTAVRQADYEVFQKRDLSDHDYVYVWADGVTAASVWRRTGYAPW